MSALLPQRRDVVPVNHLVLPERSSFFSSEKSFDEHGRRHDELEVAATNAVADVEHAVPVNDIGRVAGIENGVKLTGRHTGTPSTQSTERSLSAVLCLSKDSPRMNIHPAEFAMHVVRGNRLVPLFVIPRWSSSPSAKREPAEFSPLLRRAHRDWRH
jgi:hypothetical protein